MPGNGRAAACCWCATVYGLGQPLSSWLQVGDASSEQPLPTSCARASMRARVRARARAYARALACACARYFLNYSQRFRLRVTRALKRRVLKSTRRSFRPSCCRPTLQTCNMNMLTASSSPTSMDHTTAHRSHGSYNVYTFSHGSYNVHTSLMLRSSSWSWRTLW